ncbi:SDR family oxidoreductase [Desulfosporosinus shakirovi]|uniref:SDR family oxidoreductase n=1 Tax=Desulfosporosinus shakirovi TaxID=2885154 RepID=UPI001E3918DE|nr:SDR family oxidoreductase [Desulfosporosinus sp. SRJS8]MCB8815377.1 SDR family oxidoreductase [Desulfosporosinus sp. SRJS8]
MRIFVTGATGFVGAAVVKELIGAGHEVIGLARSDAAVKSLMAAGAQVHKGDLEDLASLREGAANADGIIHTAFNHDFSKFKDSCGTDRRVIELFGTVLAGSERPLVVTSALGILPQGHLATEETLSVSGPAGHLRAASEEAAMMTGKHGVRVAVIRLAPTVHGEGDHNFIPILIRLAKEKGISAYIGEGSNCWPAVHRLDAARLFRLVLEKGVAGSRYHAVAEEGIPFREIAGVIGRQLNLPVVSITPQEAANHFGWFVNFAAMDVPALSQLTREQLAWQPTQLGLIQDLSLPHYFKA